MKILLVEDNTLSRLVLEEQLHSLNCEVSACPNAEAALEAYKQTFYPLILLDLGLPGMDGFEFSRHIRALPQGDRSMILVITAWDQPEDIQAALDAGADDYLIKPVNIEQLQVRLTILERQWQNLIKRKRAEEALQQSEERFRDIVENAEAGYFFVDKNGYYRDVNKAWLRMHGYTSREEVLGRHFSITQVEADLEQAQQLGEKVLHGESIPVGESTRRCKDGTIKFHTFSSKPVIKNDQIIGLE